MGVLELDNVRLKARRHTLCQRGICQCACTPVWKPLQAAILAGHDTAALIGGLLAKQQVSIAGNQGAKIGNISQNWLMARSLVFLSMICSTLFLPWLQEKTTGPRLKTLLGMDLMDLNWYNISNLSSPALEDQFHIQNQATG